MHASSFSGDPSLDDISPSLSFPPSSTHHDPDHFSDSPRNVFETFASNHLPKTARLDAASGAMDFSKPPEQAPSVGFGAGTQLSADADPSDIVDHFINNGLLTTSLSEFTSATSQVTPFLMRTNPDPGNTPSPLANSISWPGSHSDTPPTPDLDVEKKIQADCICKECGKSFNSVWYLKQHAVKHSSERPFKCKFCHKTYRFRSNLYQHKCPDRDKHMVNRGSHGRGPRSANSKRKLSMASSSSVNSITPQISDPSQLNSSLALSALPRPPKNLQTPRKSPARPGSRSRSRGAGSPSFTSATVSAKLPVHLSPTQGMNLITDGIGVLMGESAQGEANTSSTTPDNGDAQSSSANGRSRQPDESQGMNKEEIEEYLTRFRGRLHQCAKCRVWFPSREYLTRHMASHTFVDSRVKCLHCSESFESEGEYAVHKQRHAPQSLHVCPVCHGNFRSRLALKRHLAECSEVSPMKTASPNRPLSFVDRSPPHYSAFYELEELNDSVAKHPESAQRKAPILPSGKESDSGIGASDSPSSGVSDSSSYGTPPGGSFLMTYGSSTTTGMSPQLRKLFLSREHNSRTGSHLEDEGFNPDDHDGGSHPENQEFLHPSYLPGRDGGTVVASTIRAAPIPLSRIKRTRLTFEGYRYDDDAAQSEKNQDTEASKHTQPLQAIQDDSGTTVSPRAAKDMKKQIGKLFQSETPHNTTENRCQTQTSHSGNSSKMDPAFHSCSKCKANFKDVGAFNNHKCTDQ